MGLTVQKKFFERREQVFEDWLKPGTGQPPLFRAHRLSCRCTGMILMCRAM